MADTIKYCSYPEGWEACKKFITVTDDPKAQEAFMLGFAKVLAAQ